MLKKRIFITGIAGFIGYHLALHLKKRGDQVMGIDNFNSYYDPSLKEMRCKRLICEGIPVERVDLCNGPLLKQLLEQQNTTHFVHLAAQAGVRHSLLAPNDYVASNLQGFVSVLEACRMHPHLNLIYASSSSVYGANKELPFRIEDRTDQPLNLYGATKKANEVMAHAYHHLYGLRVTGLRFFTVYGPWGRPDMAYFRFAKQILLDQPIQIFNQGKMRRDFTYIDDIIQGTTAAIDLGAECELFNLGNSRPIELLYLIELLEAALGKKAIKEFLPMQAGEGLETYAEIEKSRKILNFSPATPIEVGIPQFVHWMQSALY